MPLDRSGKWKKKYDFDLLDIGESMFVSGIIGNIASSASSWGTRYSIWLRVKPTKGGANVTRLASPIYRKEVKTPDRKRLRHVEQQLVELKEGLRAITLLILKVQNTLEDRLEHPSQSAAAKY